MIRGKSANWEELAKDCVCFANGQGGRLLIGIEDGETLPPAEQKIEVAELERLRKRIGELTVNVQVLPRIVIVADRLSGAVENDHEGRL